MTSYELDGRISQFIDRKSQEFPEIFDSKQTLRNRIEQLIDNIHIPSHNLGTH